MAPKGEFEEQKVAYKTTLPLPVVKKNKQTLFSETFFFLQEASFFIFFILAPYITFLNFRFPPKKLTPPPLPL